MAGVVPLPEGKEREIFSNSSLLSWSHGVSERFDIGANQGANAHLLNGGRCLLPAFVGDQHNTLFAEAPNGSGLLRDGAAIDEIGSVRDWPEDRS